MARYRIIKRAEGMVDEILFETDSEFRAEEFHESADKKNSDRNVDIIFDYQCSGWADDACW